MAFTTTLDERYYGGWTSLSANAIDASKLLNSDYVLADGKVGYGASTDAYFLADEDIYSLGNLTTGYYSVDVDDTTWDWGNFDFGSVSTFSVLNSWSTTDLSELCFKEYSFIDKSLSKACCLI